jgi:hypothetical protein
MAKLAACEPTFSSKSSIASTIVLHVHCSDVARKRHHVSKQMIARRVNALTQQIYRRPNSRGFMHAYVMYVPNAVAVTLPRQSQPTFSTSD